jgi:hypothetical protein
MERFELSLEESVRLIDNATGVEVKRRDRQLYYIKDVYTGCIVNIIIK